MRSFIKNGVSFGYADMLHPDPPDPADPQGKRFLIMCLLNQAGADFCVNAPEDSIEFNVNGLGIHIKYGNKNYFLRAQLLTGEDELFASCAE